MPEIYNPNSGFFISGSDLETTDRVKWGDVNISSDLLIIQGTTGISGALPPDVSTSEIFVIDSDGSSVSLGEQVVRLKEADKINLTSFAPSKGKVDDIVSINGSNFYKITNVRFGTEEASFNVLSPTNIEASVPKNAGQSRIQIHSSLRSGDLGTAYNTATFSDYFTSRPQIKSLSIKSLRAGEILTVNGSSLTSVQSVQFNGIDSLISPINVTNDSLQVTVPTGATRGNLILLTQTNESVTGENPESIFNHDVVINSVTPSGVFGKGTATINGSNFFSGTLSYESGDFVKVRFGGVDTNKFKLLGPNLITGEVPNNVKTGLNLVSLYSDLGSLYSGGKYIYVSGKVPSISGVSPSYGITGSRVNITGKNLVSITGVNFTSTSDSTVSYTITGSGIVPSKQKDKLEVKIPTGFQSGYSSGQASLHVDIKLSGDFGTSNTLKSGFYVVGKPVIENVLGDPNTPKEPALTGSITGLNLFEDSKINFIDSVTSGSLGSTKVVGSLVSSDNTTYVKTNFNYPESFKTTGIVLQVENIGGGSNLSQAISVFKEPIFSGFTPLSGVAGDTVKASGFFSGFKNDGITLGGKAVSDLTSLTTTGASFKIPSGATSDFFQVVTSGGNKFSNKKFSLVPDIPQVTGLSPSPKSPLTYSVFSEGQRLSVLGTNLNLVNEVIFFNSLGQDVHQSTFASKSPNSIFLDLPQNAFSGNLRVVDRFGRVATGTQNFNIAKISGDSDVYATFDEQVTFSGSFFSGLNASFRDEFGSIVSGTQGSSSNITGDIFSFNSRIPREVVSSKILVTGSNNDSLLTTESSFFPLATVSGVSGDSSLSLNLNQEIEITGINSIGAFKSGENVIGITGEGKNSFYDIKSYEKVSGEDGKNLSIFKLDIGEEFTGSGQFFILNAWEDYLSESYDFSASKTNENINKIVTSDFYNIVYPSPVISGISTGTKFNSNISGFISGDNLKPVTGVFISGSGAGAITGTSDFVNVTNKLIRFSFPSSSLEVGSGFLVVDSSRGIATSQISGGQIEIIRPVSVTSFSPLEGITGSTVNLVGSGFNDASEVVFTTVSSSGNASFTINSDSGIAAIVPKFTISEGQDATITVKGVQTDQQTASNRFTVIHDAPTVQFNVVSGRAAPEVGANRSAIFTVVETIDGVDYYVTKMINPDGREIRMNTERV